VKTIGCPVVRQKAADRSSKRLPYFTPRQAAEELASTAIVS
jgi:hypothetical protein